MISYFVPPSRRPARVALVFRPASFSCLLLLALAFLGIAAPAYAQKTDRAKAVGHRMFCMCGCKQILVECNHVGCTMSTSMLKKLDAEVASGKSDDLVLQSFVQDFGGTVVAEPPTGGFNWLGWIMPFLFVGVGFLLIRTILARWTQPVPAMPSGQPMPQEMLDRIRVETEKDE